MQLPWTTITPKASATSAPFYGNFGVLVRTYAYCLMIGREGLRAVSNHAVLNANYLFEKLRKHFAANYPAPGGSASSSSSASIPGKPAARAPWISPSALIDRGIHPPTVYFPLTTPEAMMVEPTEPRRGETLTACRGHGRTGGEICAY